jgi:putative FmdB family regulatory protein
VLIVAAAICAAATADRRERRVDITGVSRTGLKVIQKNLYNSGFWTIFAECFMPIYAYRCEACGFAKDVLQKISDDTLTLCPSCGQDGFRKQVTAAGFQLKGSGWYVTDFRNGSGGAAKPAPSGEAADGAKAGGKEGNKDGGSAAGGDSGAAATASAPAAAPAAATAAPAAAATPKPAA